MKKVSKKYFAIIATIIFFILIIPGYLLHLISKMLKSISYALMLKIESSKDEIEDFFSIEYSLGDEIKKYKRPDDAINPIPKPRKPNAKNETIIKIEVK